MSRRLSFATLFFASTLAAQSPTADIGMDILVPASASSGQTVEIRIAADNQGPSDAPFVRVDIYSTDLLLSLSNDTAAGWSCSFSTPFRAHCELPLLPIGRRDIVLLGATLNKPGTARLEAVINANVQDPDVSDRRVVREINVTAAAATADLSVALRDSATIVNGRGVFRGDVAVTNNGPSPISAVTVLNSHEGLDDGTVRDIAAGWSCGAGLTLGRLDCIASAPILSGETRILTYTIEGSGDPRIVKHEVIVRGANFTDPIPLNNTLSASTRIGSIDLFSRVLIPIAIPETPGNFGSLFRSDATVFADVDADVPFFPVSFNCPFLCPPRGEVAAPRKTSWSVPLEVYANQANPGHLLYFPRQFEAAVFFTSHVRDKSRELSDIGTEIPVISDRDLLTGRGQLLNVAASGGYRARLRIYEPDARGGSFVVRLYARSGTSPDAPVSEQTIALTIPPNNDVAGTLQLPQRPAYAEIPLFDPRALPAAGLFYRVEVEPLTPGIRYWAFVSSTNNETQFVTLSTPHKADSN